jgi:hypothetical protein
VTPTESGQVAADAVQHLDTCNSYSRDEQGEETGNILNIKDENESTTDDAERDAEKRLLMYRHWLLRHIHISWLTIFSYITDPDSISLLALMLTASSSQSSALRQVIPDYLNREARAGVNLGVIITAALAVFPTTPWSTN